MSRYHQKSGREGIKIMIKNMKAIEYNLIMTMLKLLNERIPDIAREYGIKNTDIQIAPTYPSDLTDLKKPSIIMRKVDTRQSKIGFGNVLGQMFNNEVRGYVDVVGKKHDMMLQFDVVSATNTYRLLFESMISEGIFNNIAFNENGMIKLFDFTGDINKPEEIGNVKLIGDPSVADIHDGDSTDDYYIGVVRHNFAVIQTIVPKCEYVDLSKWMKQTYSIKL